MTALSVVGFKGEIPRLASHLLPTSNAQTAINCNLRSGDAVPLLGPTAIGTFNGGPIKSIYLLNSPLLNVNIWLRWQQIVDVALSPVLGDVTGRYYFTGTDCPRISNYDLSTASIIDYATANAAIVAVASLMTVNVSNGAQFANGQSVRLNDGTNYIIGTITGIATNALTVRVTQIVSGLVGQSFSIYGLVTVANAGTNYPYFSYKLGSPAPLNAPSIDYNYSNFVISYLDPCSALSTTERTGVTTADYIMAAVGSTQSVSVDSVSKFKVGDVVDINDGSNEMTGVVNATSTSSMTVQTIQIISGTAGNTMVAGATIATSIYTIFTATADGSVTLDKVIGNPLPSFKIKNNTAKSPIWIYKDFSAMDLPVSLSQFDFYFDYGYAQSASVVFTAGANASGAGNAFEALLLNQSVTTTTATFTVAAVGLTQSVSVTSISLLLNQTVIIDDTSGHAIQGLVTAAVGTTITVQTITILAGSAGNTMASATVVSKVAGLLKRGTASAWSTPYEPAFGSNGTPMVFNNWYTMSVFYSGETASGFSYLLKIYSGASLIQSWAITSSNPPSGSYLGWSRSVAGTTHIDNLGGQNFITQGAEKLTTYVFTYITVLGEESAPSPISNEQITSDTLNKVVTLPAIPGTGEASAYGSNFVADYGIIGRRLYRAVTVGTTSSYLLVADETTLNLSVNSFTDTKADSALSVELPSDGWLLPPTDGHSVLTLSNGIVCLASGNQICLAPSGAAHAYPENQRLSTAKPIVTMGAIDTSIVAATQGFPYLSSGTDPASYTDAVLERAYACVSARSKTYVRQLGVVYASQVGLIAVNGSSLRNITDAYFTQQDWQTLVNPSTIVAATWDDLIVGYCQPLDGTVRGFIFDPSGAEGQAWSWFDYSSNWTQVPADGFYDDPVGGLLYMVRGSELDTFATGTALQMTWQSKQWLLDYPQSFQMGKVRPQAGYNKNTTPITVSIDVVNTDDQAFSWPTLVQNSRPFTNRPYVGEEASFTVTGKWGVKQVDFASNLDELT